MSQTTLITDPEEAQKVLVLANDPTNGYKAESRTLSSKGELAPDLAEPLFIELTLVHNPVDPEADGYLCFGVMIGDHLVKIVRQYPAGTSPTAQDSFITVGPALSQLAFLINDTFQVPGAKRVDAETVSQESTEESEVTKTQEQSAEEVSDTSLVHVEVPPVSTPAA